MATTLNYDDEKVKIGEFLNTFSETGSRGRKNFLYQSAMTSLANRQLTKLHISVEDLQKFDSNLADHVQLNTNRYISLFSEVLDEQLPALRSRTLAPRDALDHFIEHRQRAEAAAAPAGGLPVPSSLPPTLLRRYEVSFKPPQQQKKQSVRDLKAADIGKLVCARGIVTRCTEVKPMMEVATYTCNQCGGETYQPVAGVSFTPLAHCPSTLCRAGPNSRLTLETRGSKFTKFQEIKMQEHSDQVPTGSIPRCLTVHCRGENTRQCLPGDYVLVSGVYLPSIKTGFRAMSSGLLTETYMEAHDVQVVDKLEEAVQTGSSADFTEEELEIIQSCDFYNRMACSIAPEIFGHEDVKKALLLLMVGGVDRNCRGMKIRGAINICLMGDPGVAKSQLLSYVDRLSPRSVYTTGRGSSGVGLTAAVVKDPMTNEMVLEGGALVLADQGVCCIDEFDKMFEGDRTAIHEVMEQQTISIAKAGILTTLNARVSILAAANPAFGRYNPKKTIEQNIQLPAALLSRFDLLWLIQDKPEHDNDLRLAQHVTYVHMHSRRPPQEHQPLDMQLLRKYIAAAKLKTPTIPEELTDYIASAYTQLRKEARNNRDATFTSARTLLAICRVSTALAKLRLANQVEKDDVAESIRLMEMSKDSLNPGTEHLNRVQDVRDKVFTAVREMLPTGGQRTLKVSDVYDRLTAKGFNPDQIESALREYQNLNIWLLNQNKTKLTFV